MIGRHRSTSLAAAMLAAVLIASPAGATPGTSNDFSFEGTDFSVEVVSPPDGVAAVGSQNLLDDDPLRLVPQRPFVQKYSLDIDHFEAWLCGNTGYTMKPGSHRPREHS